MDKKTIHHIASLARLRLTAKEEEKMGDELSSALDYINKLQEVDTETTEPVYQTTGLFNSFRADNHREDFRMDEELNKKLIGQAPDKKDRFVKVKSILKK